MVKKSKFLKNLLTTTSALAVLAGGVNSAAAAARTITANPSDGTGVGMDGGGAVAVAANSTLQFNIVSAFTHTGGNADIAAINIHGITGSTFLTGAVDGVVGSIVNTGGAVAAALAVTIDSSGANRTLTLTGGAVNPALAGASPFTAAKNDYAGLGGIVLGKTGNTGTLIIHLADNNQAITIEGTIDEGVGAKGHINVAVGNVTFKGAIGGTQAIESLELAVGTTATLSADAKFSGVVAGANTIKLGDGATLNVANKTLAGNADVIDGAAAGKGTLNLAGTTIVGMAIGTNARLNLVNIGAGTTDFRTGGDFKATTITLNHDDAVLKLSTAQAAIEGNITTKTHEKGKVTLAGNFDHKITGSVGAAGKALESITFSNVANNNSFTVKDGDFYVKNVINENFAAGANGQLIFGAAAGKSIGGTIGAAGNGKLTLVQIHSNDVGGGGAATYTLTKDSKVYATTLDLAGAAVDNVLILGNDTFIDGAVDTTNANSGTLEVRGDAEITGAIGGVSAINFINFTTTAGKTLKVGGNAIKTHGNITFAVDGTLLLSKDQGVTITAAKIDAANKGTIDAAALTTGKVLKIIGDVGNDDANKLNVVDISGGATLELNGAKAHIGKIVMGSTDARVILSKDSSVSGHSFVVEHEAGKGILEIAEVTKLLAKTVFGTAENLANKVDFKANRILTIEDGVNLYTANGIHNDAAGNGALTFAGASIVKGVVGSNNAIGDINVNGGGKILTFLDEVKAANVVVADAATVQFFGDLTSTTLKGAAAGKGTAEFLNVKAATVKGVIGAGAALASVKVSGADLTFDMAALDTNKLDFTKNDNVATTVTFTGAVDLAGTTVTTASTKRAHNITVAADQTITGDIGTKDNVFGNLNLSADKTVKISTANFFAGVTTKTTDTVKVNLDAPNAIIYGVGSSTAQVLEFNVNESGEIRGDIFAKNATVAAGKTATFATGVTVTTTGKLELGGANSVASFADGTVSNTLITTAANATGQVLFLGNAVIKKDIGAPGSKLDNVTFSSTTGDKVAQLGSEIHAGTVSLNKSTLSLTGNATLDGTTTMTDTKLALGQSKLTFQGGTTSTVAGSLTISTIFDGTTAGTVAADGVNTKLDLSKATGVTIDLDASGVATLTASSFAPAIETNNGEIIFPAAGVIKLGDVKTNNFLKWTYSDATGLISSASIAQQVVSEDLTKANITDAETLARAGQLVDPKNTGQAEKLTVDLGKMPASDVAKAVTQITESGDASTAGTEAQAGVLNDVHNQVSARTADASGIGVQVASNQGVAAGDEDTRYGVWGTPFYSQTSQKFRKNTSGYKAKSFGGMVGFDTMANDTMTIGIALTAVKTDLKHRDYLAGGKTKVDTMMVSIYGLQQISENWFLQGIASFGSSKAKSTLPRLTSTGTQTATGKYDTMTYGGEALAAYKFKVAEGAALIPMGGLRYARFNDSGYTETGTTNRNLTVSKKSTDKIEAVLGARAMMETEASGIKITPEVHAFVSQDLKNKSPRVDVRLDGLVNPLTPKSAKPAKTFFNVGLGVNIADGRMEYGAGYDAQMANKYVSHQGTLKVRVNF